MLRFDLNDLRIFLALTHTLNISRAADQVGLTASAVSLRLKKLEEAFDTQLFIRESRGLVLTAAGHALLNEARELSNGAAKLEETMAAFLAQDDRELVIASNTTGLQNFLAPYISQFLRAHPGRCRFLERSSHDGAEMVREGTADVGFGLISEAIKSSSDLITRAVTHDRHVLVTSLTHPLAQQKSVAYADTLLYPQITQSQHSPMAAAMKERASRSGATLLPILQLPSFDLILRVVAEDIGVAVVPASALRGPHGHEVAVVQLTDAWADRHLGFYLPKHRPSSPRAKAFVDEFVCTFEPVIG